MSKRAHAIAVVEQSRQTHVDWLAYQESTPDWEREVSERPSSVGKPQHHRESIAGYDVVLEVLRGES